MTATLDFGMSKAAPIALMVIPESLSWKIWLIDSEYFSTALLALFGAVTEESKVPAT